MHAPIGSNVLYPHFVVVTDPAKRAAVAGFYKRAWDACLAMLGSLADVHFEDPIHEAQMPVSRILRPTWPSTWRMFPRW